MDVINVDICMGTTCFVMGGSNLQGLDSMIKNKFKDRVTVNFKTCLGLCQNNEYNKAPYVKIGDDVVSGATVEQVLKVLESKIHE